MVPASQLSLMLKGGVFVEALGNDEEGECDPHDDPTRDVSASIFEAFVVRRVLG